MKIKFIITILLVSLNLYSQKSSEYDYKIPLPPESYQFKKRFLNNVSLYTGQPSIDIPIYTINLDGMEIPISISYNTGGIKVEEEATSVGLGWSLNIGGQVTRSNNGLPDERYFMNQDYNGIHGIGNFKETLHPNTLGHFNCSQNSLYADRVAMYDNSFRAGDNITTNYPLADIRPDEFFYSFFGHSGKFMFNQELKKFITFPLDDININYELTPIASAGYFLDNFNIQLPNGYNLILGKDGRSSISAYGGTPFDQSWQLKKIISTKNKEITYSYFTARYNLYTNLSNHTSQVLTRKFNDIFGSIYESNITNNIEQLVSQIVFPEGKINFSYGDRIDLQTGAKKLQEITVYDNANKLIKKIELVQSYFDSNINLLGKNAVDKRLKLDGVSFYDKENKVVENFNFTYYLFDKIPSKYSKAQDHWGYFNGKETNFSLFPKNLLPQAYNVESSLGFNRDLDTLYAKTFSLKSIKFPEGGIKYYDYESHIALTGSTTGIYFDAISDERYSIKSQSFNISGYKLNYFYPEPNESNTFNKVFYSEPFETTIHSTSLKGGESSILINSNLPFQVPDPNINSAFNKIEFYLEKKQADGTFKMLYYLGTISKDENRSGSIKGSFEVGGKDTYRMKIIVTQNYLFSNPKDYEYYHNTSFVISYRDKVKDDVHVGGLRIKNIKTYTDENLTGLKYTTNFQYLDDNKMTSGRMMNVPTYAEYISIFSPMSSTDTGSTITEHQLGIRLSSSSTLSLYKTSNSNVGYTKVSQIDIDNINKKEIKESNYFSWAEPKFSEIPLFDDLREQEPKDWHRGKLLKKLFYNNQTVVKEEQYNYYGDQIEKNMGYVDEINYQLIDRNSFCLPESGVSKHIYPSNVTHPGLFSKFHPLLFEGISQFNKYSIENNVSPPTKIPYFKIYTGFDKLKSKIVRDYFNGNVIEQTQEYIYNNTPINIQLTSIKNSTSLNNDVLETKYFYAQNPEMANEPFRNELIAKNMITIPLKEESFRGANKLSEKITKYGSYPSSIDGLPLILPQYIYTKKANSVPDQLEKRVTYENYDTLGNISQYTIENSNPVTIIWGYNKTLPIAKIENATNTQVTLALGVSNINNLNETNLAAIDALRNNNSFGNSMITTYTHIPLVGVSTITDIKGMTSYYEYDTFGRLKFVKDKDLNLVQEYSYDYKKVEAIQYESIARSGSFTKKNCASGGVGSTIPFSQAAGAYKSIISQTDADSKGLELFNKNGEVNANAKGVCSFRSIARSGIFTRTNCASGAVVGPGIAFSQSEGSYVSEISQADADSKGLELFNANGEANANANGTCTFSSIALSGPFERDNCESVGAVGESVVFSQAAGVETSLTSQADADSKAIARFNKNGRAYARLKGKCIFSSIARSGSFVKNDCLEGEEGSSVTYNQLAGAATSTVSQVAADDDGLVLFNRLGQANANQNGTCTKFITYYPKWNPVNKTLALLAVASSSSHNGVTLRFNINYENNGSYLQSATIFIAAGQTSKGINVVLPAQYTPTVQLIAIERN